MRNHTFTLSLFQELWSYTIAELYANGVPLMAKNSDMQYWPGDGDNDLCFSQEIVQNYILGRRLSNSCNITGKANQKALDEGIFSRRARGASTNASSSSATVMTGTC